MSDNQREWRQHREGTTELWENGKNIAAAYFHEEAQCWLGSVLDHRAMPFTIQAETREQWQIEAEKMHDLFDWAQKNPDAVKEYLRKQHEDIAEIARAWRAQITAKDVQP